MELDEESIRNSFKKEGDDISSGDLDSLKGFASSLISFIDSQDDSTKSLISEAFGDDKLSELKNLVE